MSKHFEAKRNSKFCLTVMENNLEDILFNKMRKKDGYWFLAISTLNLLRYNFIYIFT